MDELEKMIMERHSRNQMLKIVRYVGTNKERFNKLVSCCLKGGVLAQRASWPLRNCGKKNSIFLIPQLGKLLSVIEKPCHPALKRSVVTLLEEIDIPPRLDARVIDICFQFLNDREETVAVKAFSMTVLAKMCLKHEDLLGELLSSIESQLPFASGAIHSRARRVFKYILKYGSEEQKVRLMESNFRPKMMSDLPIFTTHPYDEDRNL